MLIKIIGFFVIVGTCTAAGLEISKELSGRVKILLEWIGAVKLMQCNIAQFKMPLDGIYTEIGRNSGMLKEFFEKVRGADFKTWKREICRMKYLSKKDIIILNKLGGGLGEKLSYEQINFLDYIKKLLEENLQEAKLAEKNDGKMYKSLSFFAGVGLAVLFI